MGGKHSDIKGLICLLIGFRLQRLCYKIRVWRRWKVMEGRGRKGGGRSLQRTQQTLLRSPRGPIRAHWRLCFCVLQSHFLFLCQHTGKNLFLLLFQNQDMKHLRKQQMKNDSLPSLSTRSPGVTGTAASSYFTGGTSSSPHFQSPFPTNANKHLLYCCLFPSGGTSQSSPASSALSKTSLWWLSRHLAGFHSTLTMPRKHDPSLQWNLRVAVPSPTACASV